MKVTLHGVVTSICLLGLVGLLKFQGLMVKNHNEFVKNHNEFVKDYNEFVEEVIAIDEFQDDRLLSLENTIQPGLCIRPDTAQLKLWRNNTVIFTVTTCDGRKMSMTRNIGAKA